MPPIFFLHIPKTAGTNIRFYLYDALGRDEVCFAYSPETLAFGRGAGQPICLPPRTLKRFAPKALGKFRVVFGHVGIEMFPDLPEAVYGTFLRRPVDRIRSWFGHVERVGNASRDLVQDLRTGRTGYDALLRAHRLTALDNTQVRSLSGCRKPFGQVSEADYETACRNIDRRFAFVGVTERFTESVELMLARLELPRIAVPTDMNRGQPPRGACDLDAEAFYARWDQRLHAYAERRLDAELAGR
jgi:hypothetical protein